MLLTLPEEGLNGRSATVNQGKALGGSSAINAQVFVPPTKANADAWEALGNEGWNWDLLQKYITKAYTYPSGQVDKKLEKALGIDGWATRNDTAQGPILTSFPEISVQTAWASTLETIGYSIAKDPFLGAASGSFSNLHSIDPTTKERSYSASAYYQPYKNRENLIVLTGALVEKVVFDRETGIKATGVRYTKNGETKTITATREVILAAGTFQSPKILELSGIGNAQILRKYNIELINDLPGVGENLQDHLVCV